MAIMRRGLVAMTVVGSVGALVGGWGAAAWAARPTKADLCETAKIQAVGKKAQCLTQEQANEVRGKNPDFAKCESNFARAFARAEQKAGPGVCPTEGDKAAIEAMVDTCMGDIASALAGAPPPPACPPATPFPATGQTTCWDKAGTVIACAGTGQDGDIQAGAALSYTDNGDGTITDTNTGLRWEKKSDDGTIHDQDDTYTWADSFAVFIAALNTRPCFAGYCDWRLPNVKELQTIVDYETTFPAVSPAFNNSCGSGCTVLTCSCTPITNYYWASSSYANNAVFAWGIDPTGGQIGVFGKSELHRVRAVRGGL